MPATQTAPAARLVTITGEIFETNRSSTTLFLSLVGEERNVAQVMFKGAKHAQRAETYLSLTTGKRTAVDAILAIEAASFTTLPAVCPGFSFAAAIVAA